MKNKIFSFVIAALICSVVPFTAVSAEDSTESIQLHKSATYDYATHIGEITLESYVPGEVKLVQEAKAIDAVLVLDFSGSMLDGYSTSENYTRVVTDERYTYTDYGSQSDGDKDDVEFKATKNAFSSNNKYVKANYNGTEYQLYIIRKKGVDSSTGSNKDAYRMWTYITVNSQRIYVTPDGGFIKAHADSPATSNITFAMSGWPIGEDGVKITPVMDQASNVHQLYCTYKTEAAKTNTKIKALEKAVGNFVDLVAEHAKKTGLKDRISIVQYQGNTNYDKIYVSPQFESDSRRTESYYLNSSNENFLAEYTYDYKFNFYDSSTKWNMSDERNKQLCGVLKRFVDVSEPNATNVLKHSLTDLRTIGNTPTHIGVKMAQKVMDTWGRTTQTKDGKDVGVERFVIVFSDGQPTKSTSDIDFSGTGNTAVSTAYDIKHSATKPSTVYTIFCPKSTEDTGNGRKFMQRLSSDYPDAKTYNAGTDKEEHKYYKYATSDLTQIFENITQEILVVASESYGVNTTMRDFINNNYFQYPDNADESAVKVYENPLSAYNSTTKVYTFSDELKDITSSVKIKIKRAKDTGEDNDQIIVYGYDYSANWCGVNQQTGTVHGNRLVVKLPFVFKGGEDVSTTIATNDDKSGMYPAVQKSDGTTEFDSEGIPKSDETKAINYNVPSITFCTLTITRKNLDAGETAIYRVEEKESGKFVANVALGGEKGVNSVSKSLYGLPGENGFKFKVTETGWNWAYDKSGTMSKEASVSEDAAGHYHVDFEFDGAHLDKEADLTHPAETHNHDEDFIRNKIDINSLIQKGSSDK